MIAICAVFSPRGSCNETGSTYTVHEVTVERVLSSIAPRAINESDEAETRSGAWKRRSRHV